MLFIMNSPYQKYKLGYNKLYIKIHKKRESIARFPSNIINLYIPYFLKPAGYVERKVFCGKILISTRRLDCNPSTVVFSATG